MFVFKRLGAFFIMIIVLLGMLCGCGKSSVPLPEGFKLNSKEITISSINDTVTLYDGPVIFSDVTWSSADDAVATFENGVVTAKGFGKTEVYAEYFGVKHTCLVDCSTLIYTPDMLPKDASKNTGYEGDAVLAPPKSFDGPSTFFDNAAFIGDSVSLKLSYYAEESGELGDALFLVSGSYGVGNAVDETMMLVYQGKEMSPQDALAASGVDKAFVMMGMNDLGRFGVDGTLEYWDTFIDNIYEKNPGITICIQSMTPVWTGGETGDLNNKTIDEYNKKLKEFAAKKGCSYMDIASYMKDSSGGLATDYCSDNFVHLTDAGAQAWVKVLKAYVGR
ncbi:MAG: hypothetical protein E7513_00485 [Ruminococcaceae bacterium]|nr:hypothetical protein [Oscillospiraceae bacterium]